MRVLSGLLLGLVLACGDDPLSPEETARAALADRGIASTDSAFVAAADDGDLEVVRLAAFNGHLSVVRYLVEHGASFEMETDSGFTPRDMAALRGHTDVVEYLDSL